MGSDMGEHPVVAADPAETDPTGPQAKLRLIRVKRKRGAEAPEDLVVEGLGVPSKRQNTLADALDGLGLGVQEGAGPQEGEPPAAAFSSEGGAPERQRQRFRRVSTLSAAQLSQMSQEQLQGLLSARQQQQQQQQPPQQRRAGIKEGGGAPGSGFATAEAALAASQAARYEQIRRRRGLTNFEVTEQAADPLQQLASVFDVVRREGEQQGQAAAGAGGSRGEGRSGMRGGGRLSQQQRLAEQYDEGTLLCNYLPMVREYLQAQGQDLPQQPPQQQQQQQAGSSGETGAAASGMGEGKEGDDYVYDLYAEMEEGGQGEQQEQAAWWEAHTQGRAPVVQIIDDDNWLVVEASDVEDSDADSEDSNAESYYAHDYPDEGSGWGSSEEEPDPEGYVHKRQGGRTVGSGTDSDGW